MNNKKTIFFSRRLLGLFLTLCLITPALAEVVLHDLSEKLIPFSSLKGKWVMINYWASWCEACLEEIPTLNQFYAENKHKLSVFAVNYDAQTTLIQQQLIKKYHIAYPSLQVDPADALKLGDIRGVPVTFVFDPNGQLNDTLYGGQTMQSLNQFFLKKSW